MNACEYLARVGFASLLAMAEESASAEGEEVAEVDHARIKRLLLSRKPEPIAGRNGVRWIRRITWPDRVPALKVWAGKAELHKTIAARMKLVKTDECTNLYDFEVPYKTVTGLDRVSAQSAVDIGFSPADLGLEIVQRPGLELLAIVGLEALPLVSVSYREVGVIHAGRLVVWAIEPRGGHHKRWGEVRILPLEEAPIPSDSEEIEETDVD